MSKYDVKVGLLARKTIKTLPVDALTALEVRLRELAAAPSDLQPGRRPQFRSAVFGPGGEGMIFATVSDELKVIIVDQVVWAG